MGSSEQIVVNSRGHLRMKTTRQLLLGVFFISMGALALEIVLTRIFSVKMWYHFAFLAISMALMGSAMAGVLLYFFPRLTRPEMVQKWIGRASIALAVAVPIIFLIYLRIPFQPVLMNRDGAFSFEQIGWLALIYVLLSIPFFLSGSVLALALSGWPNDAGKIYAADLIGAALGCLLSVAALAQLGGVNALFLLSLVLAVAASAFIYGRRGWAIVAGLVLLFSAGLLVSNLASPWVRIVVNKAGGEEPPIVYEKWNIHSRVTVYEPEVFPFFWGISSQKWEETIAAGGKWDHALLLIDAVAGTPIQSFDGDLDAVQFLRTDLTAIAYHLIDDPETLIIGPGGGRDVLAALASGAPQVTAVEVNPAVIEAVKGQFAEFSGYLYERPDVNVVVADARGYIERSPSSYDVIQASLIDTWAAGGSGAFALSENSLYTREAFASYYNHLSEKGILSISRWYLPGRPAETLRLVTTGLSGWEDAGVLDAREHIAVIAMLDPARAQTEGLSTTLFKRDPFTAQEVTRLQEVASFYGYQVLYAPGLEPFEEVGRFIVDRDHNAFIATYPLDISPASDDRPFFFNLILFGDLLDPAFSASGVYRTSMESIYILFAVIGVTVVLSTIFILGPLWLGAKRRNLARPSAMTLAYFGTLGLAFMMVEIPTMQQLTVYLGQPVYSLAVVLFSLLLFSGLGSWWSGRWAFERIAGNMQRIFPLLVIFLLVHTLLSRVILVQTLHFELGARLIIAVLLLAVLGFLMGMPFPVGIRWVGRRLASAVPWLWGINGVTSVLGSALATALSIHIGFRLTLVVATFIYASSALLFFIILRRAAPEIGTTESTLQGESNTAGLEPA
jgi:SAM-dependent methyltransferase